MMWNIPMAPQGWQCPTCARVYSPTQPMCMYCPATPAVGTGTAIRVDCACIRGAELHCQNTSCPRRFPSQYTPAVSAQPPRSEG